MAPEQLLAKPANPASFLLQFSLPSRTWFHLILFFSAIPCPHPCSHFLFPQSRGISAGTAHSVWWAWGCIQRSLELGGPQAGTKQCVPARAWQGLQPSGVGRKEGLRGGRQRAAGEPGASQSRRPEVGVGRPFELGREILASHFLSNPPGSLVGSPCLGGATLAKNPSFLFFFH